MSLYQHKKISLWRVASIIIRGISGLLRLWPLVLIFAVIVSPVSPHLRWQYTYRDFGTVRIYHHCTYFGVGGFVDYVHGDKCPFITFINRNNL